MQWDEIGRLTKADKRLVHCQFSPENRYKLTKEQWLRAGQIVAEEYGIAHHPRAIVLHPDGKNPHIHLTFQRTDPNTLKAWDDSFSYVANERASLRIAKEFGHRIIPGKHAKRDRQKQPEFPRAEMSRAEAQLAKRTGRDLKNLKAELAAMKDAADSPEAFKAAIENAGFILANGERGYTIVDERGAAYNLARQLKMKVAEVNEYMRPVPLTALPTAEQAQALQTIRRLNVANSDAPVDVDQEPLEENKRRVAQNARERGEAPEKPQKKPRTIDRAVKAEVTALRAWSDGAKAFKTALEEAGYTLARGQTGYCLVSQDDVYSLVRYAGTTKVKLDALMSPIPLDSLPSVKEVIAAQREAQKRAKEPPFEELFDALENTTAAQDARESKFLEPKPDAPPQMTPSTAGEIDLDTRMEISARDMAAEAIAEAQRRSRPPADPELEALEEALAKRQQKEATALSARQESELRVKETELDRQIAIDIEYFRRIQALQTEEFLKERQEYRTGIWGIVDALQSRWNPTLAAEKAQARELERKNFYRRLARERADYEVLIQQNKQLEIENLIEYQRLQRDALAARAGEERERYVREYHEAKRAAAETGAQRREEEELERNEDLREGPPPPKLGKS